MNNATKTHNEWLNTMKDCISREYEGIDNHRGIAKFEKVSFKQFEKDLKDCLGEKTLKAMFDADKNPLNSLKVEKVIEKFYENIKLPKRATKGSAGYDFYMPYSVTLSPGETVKIPTGIRCRMCYDWVLKMYPRSGLGFKYRLQLNNTVGIIDSDYFYSDNEGHIMAKITNDTNENKVVSLSAGSGFMQGIFVQYGITVDDDTTEERNGGFGSTDSANK